MRTPSYFLLEKIKNLVKRALLRGSFRSWLISHRARQIDEAYVRTISDEALSPSPAIATATAPGPTNLKHGSRLSRILYIGICMWEQDQLFPEIRKICQLDALDLGPFLKDATDHRAAVVSAIRNHASSPHLAEPDLILFYARPSLLSEDAFSEIRRRWSCPLLGMNLDDRVEFFPYGILKSGNDDYARWCRSFDLNLTSSMTAVDWYRRRGAEVRYFPQGFRPDPRFLHPPERIDFEFNFSFVGSWKPEREHILEQLAAYGLQPALFGRGWPNGRWIDDPATVFRASQINLGIGYALASAQIANAKGRDIECPGTGACYLTTYHWELAEMFDIGKEVLCYRNFEELVELHSFYSKRPEVCLKIARAAHKRAHSEHTWENRLRGLFANLGFALNPLTTNPGKRE